MPERLRVVGMVGDVPVAPVEGDLVIGGHRHLGAVAPPGARTVDSTATRRSHVPERSRGVGIVVDVPVASVEGDLVIGGHFAAVAPAGARTDDFEADEVITRA